MLEDLLLDLLSRVQRGAVDQQQFEQEHKCLDLLVKIRVAGPKVDPAGKDRADRSSGVRDAYASAMRQMNKVPDAGR